METRRGVYAATNIGKVRLMNEDQAFALKSPHNNDVLLVVCDGMGGQNRGDYAAKLASDTLKELFLKGGFLYRFFPRIWLRQIINRTNKLVFEFADQNIEYAKMGTTVVALLVRDYRIYVANVGDSRAYLVEEKGLRKLSDDQTYVEFLYRSGQIKESEMAAHPERHVLMNAIGTLPMVSVDIRTFDYHDEVLMLCSDGLYNNVSEREMWAILRMNDSLKVKTDLLIKLANNNGGSDNIAVSLCGLEEEE